MICAGVRYIVVFVSATSGSLFCAKLANQAVSQLASQPTKKNNNPTGRSDIKSHTDFTSAPDNIANYMTPCNERNTKPFSSFSVNFKCVVYCPDRNTMRGIEAYLPAIDGYLQC